jgi:hypothetical protein
MNVFKKLHELALATALAGVATAAAAQSSSHDSDSHESRCDREHFSGCLNGVASSVTNGAGLRVSGSAYGDIARERTGHKAQEAGETQAALGRAQTGLAAGDPAATSVFALWGSYAYSDFDSDFTFAGTSLAYDAHSHSGLGGFDRLFAGRFLLGLALGYQSTESDTDFNGGGQESDGYTIAPYAAVLLNDIFSVDVSGGYVPLEYDQDRISPTDGTETRAEFDADRWFVATNLNALATVQNWVLGARVGYLRTEEEQDGYTEVGSVASGLAGTLRSVAERDIELSQVVVGGDIGYTFGAFEPYAMVSYRNDLDRDDGERAGGLPAAFSTVQPDDDDEVELNFGVRYYTPWGLTSTLEYARVEGREDFDSDTVMLTVRAAL